MPKRKVKIKASELGVVDVSFISLVNRPANRIPFRVMKSESRPMFDFGKVLKRQKPTGPQVAAYLIPKAERATLLPLLKAQGAHVDDLLEVEDILVVKQDHTLNEDECTGMQLTADIGAMVERVEKGFDPFASFSGFSDEAKARQFFPSLAATMDVLQESLFGLMYKSADPAEAAGAMDTLIDEFKAAMVGLANSLPDQAFSVMKAAEALAAETEGKETEGKETATEAKPEEEPSDESAKGAGEDGSNAGPVGAGAGASMAGEAGAEEQAVEAQAESNEVAEEAAPVTKSELKAFQDSLSAIEQTAATLATSLETLSKSMETVTAAVSALQEEHKTSADKLEAVADLADSMKNTLETVTPPITKREDHAAPVKKGRGLWDGTPLDNLV